MTMHFWGLLGWLQRMIGLAALGLHVKRNTGGVLITPRECVSYVNSQWNIYMYLSNVLGENMSPEDEVALRSEKYFTRFLKALKTTEW